MLRMMVITAHPDDEAGNFGGSLRLYYDHGVESGVLCLTPGQAATHRGGARGDQELATIRRQEFAASCEILKVSRGTVLDYPDGHLHRQDLYHLVCDLVFHVRQFRPHIMLSFGPDGGFTAHTDHAMASVFATLAFHWAGHNNRFTDQLRGEITPHRTQKLYHATANFSLPGRQPVTAAPATTVIDIAKYVETKIAAFKEHKTQAPLWPIFEEYVRKRGKKEMFHLAASVNSTPLDKEADLFDGITEHVNA
jgi:LmbE family N-acetylglucosaminyl deacetylase